MARHAAGRTPVRRHRRSTKANALEADDDQATARRFVVVVVVIAVVPVAVVVPGAVMPAPVVVRVLVAALVTVVVPLVGLRSGRAEKTGTEDCRSQETEDWSLHATVLSVRGPESLCNQI
jgi:hypothetical protein